MNKTDVEKLDNLTDKLDNPKRKISEKEAFIIECVVVRLQNVLNKYRGDEYFE
jgi:hypothetical protein